MNQREALKWLRRGGKPFMTDRAILSLLVDALPTWREEMVQELAEVGRPALRWRGRRGVEPFGVVFDEWPDIGCHLAGRDAP